MYTINKIIYNKNVNFNYLKNRNNILLIQKRHMHRAAIHITSTVINPNARPYATIGGKSMLDFDCTKEDRKNIHNNHLQLVTDFNLIYENSAQIKLYAIGSLHTKPTAKSSSISKNENYRFEHKSQEITFFKKLYIVDHTLHFLKDSKKYFDQKHIIKSVQDTEDYKALYNNVLAELKEKNIMARKAEPHELHLTGMNVLLEKYSTNDTKGYLETLKIPTTKDD